MYRVLMVLRLSVLALLAVGFLVIASAGSANGTRLFGDPNHFLFRQTLWFFCGAIPAYFAAYLINYHFWRDKKWLTVLIYLGFVVLLVAVLGTESVKGSRRWIGHGLFRMQPSEFAKLALVVSVSVYLDRLGWKLGKFWKGAVPCAIIAGLPTALVLIEPDFGAAMVMGAAVSAIFLVAGMRYHHIGIFIGIGLTVGGVLLWHNPNRMNRIRSWMNNAVPSGLTEERQAEFTRNQEQIEHCFKILSRTNLADSADCALDAVVTAKSILQRTGKLPPDKALKAERDLKKNLKRLDEQLNLRIERQTASDDERQRLLKEKSYLAQEMVPIDKELKEREKSHQKQIDAAYQLDQALVAIQRGGISGQGYTQSMQKQFYLPEAHTDFIFAIGAEEFGLGFSLGLLALFCTFFTCGMIIAARAPDRLGRSIAVGASFLIFFQVLFNIAVVTGCAPTKGIALPFISYGGTNLVSTMVAVGLLFNVGKQIELPKNRPRSTI